MRASDPPAVKSELVSVSEIKMKGGDPMMLILRLAKEHQPLLSLCSAKLSQLIESEGKPEKNGIETPLSHYQARSPTMQVQNLILNGLIFTNLNWQAISSKPRCETLHQSWRLT